MTPEEKAVVQAAIRWRNALPRQFSHQTSGPVYELLVTTSRLISSCLQCDTDKHVCPGCGANIEHGDHACRKCDERVAREAQAAPPDASTFPCWECLTGPAEDPRPWCNCRREDFGKIHPGHACRLRAHAPADCPNRPEGERDGELIWVARTWADVRPGDHVRIAILGAHGTYADGVLSAVTHLTWHVDPRSSEYRPVALQWQAVNVSFEGDTSPPRAMDPAKPVEIELTRREAQLLDDIGWPYRERMIVQHGDPQAIASTS